MTKKIILIISTVVLVAGIGVGIWYYIGYQKLAAEKKALENAGDAASAIAEGAAKGVLPDVSPDLNPVNNVKTVNPAESANPFKDIKTNPFE